MSLIEKESDYENFCHLIINQKCYFVSKLSSPDKYPDDPKE